MTRLTRNFHQRLSGYKYAINCLLGFCSHEINFCGKMGDNDWDTVTKIGYRANQTKPTTVKSNAEKNAAARAGVLQAEKKFSGTNLHPHPHSRFFPSPPILSIFLVDLLSLPAMFFLQEPGLTSR